MLDGFPKLIPALTAQIPIVTPGSNIGSARSGGLFHAPCVPDSGMLRSEPGYPVSVDATLIHGGDFLRPDHDGRHARLEVAILLRDKKGGFLRCSYTGTLSLTGGARPVLFGEPEAKTTDFGELFTHITFESSDPVMRALTDKVFVGSGRFIVEKDKPVVVEYKISEVAS